MSWNTIKSLFVARADATPVVKTYITVLDLDGNPVQIQPANRKQFKQDQAAEVARRKHDQQVAERLALEEEQRAREAANQLPHGTTRVDH